MSEAEKGKYYTKKIINLNSQKVLANIEKMY